MNDGGKLFYTGKNAGRAFAEGFSYNPFQVEEHTYCQNENPSCIIVQDDFCSTTSAPTGMSAAPARMPRATRSRSPEPTARSLGSNSD